MRNRWEDLYDHMVENHNDVFHGIASEESKANDRFKRKMEWFKNQHQTGDPEQKSWNDDDWERAYWGFSNTYDKQWKDDGYGSGESKAKEYGDPLFGSWDEGGWFFGITNMTRDDYQGGVYWKGIPVEHYDHDKWQEGDWVNKMRQDAKELERKILELEAKNIPVNMTSVLASYESKATEELAQCPTCDGLGTTWTDTAYDEGFSDLCPTCSGRGMVSTTSRIRESKPTEVWCDMNGQWEDEEAHKEHIRKQFGENEGYADRKSDLNKAWRSWRITFFNRKTKPSSFYNDWFDFAKDNGATDEEADDTWDENDGDDIHWVGESIANEVDNSMDLGLLSGGIPEINATNNEQCEVCGQLIDQNLMDYHVEQEHGLHVPSQYTQGTISQAMGDPDYDHLEDWRTSYGESKKIANESAESVWDRLGWDARARVLDSVTFGRKEFDTPIFALRDSIIEASSSELIEDSEESWDELAEAIFDLYEDEAYESKASERLSGARYEEWLDEYFLDDECIICNQSLDELKSNDEEDRYTTIEEHLAMTHDITDADVTESKANEFEFGGYSIKCDRCDGEGTINTMTIEDNMALGMADPRNYEEKCPECNGTGKIEMTSYIPDNIEESKAKKKKDKKYNEWKTHSLNIFESEGEDEPEYYDDIPEDEVSADNVEEELFIQQYEDEDGTHPYEQKEKGSKAEEAFNKGASAEEIYALVDTKPSEDDRTQSEDDYLTNLYNKTTANKSAGFTDLR